MEKKVKFCCFFCNKELVENEYLYETFIQLHKNDKIMWSKCKECRKK